MKTPKNVQKIIADNWRVLVGLAHYDEGKKRPGCDCCFCAPDIKEVHKK